VNEELAPNGITWSRDNIRRDLESVGFAGDFFTSPGYIDRDDWLAYTGKAAAVDPSGKGADETGFVILKEFAGNIYVPLATGFNGGFDTTVTRIVSEAKAHKVWVIVVEENYGGGMFEELLRAELMRQNYPCTIESRRVTGRQGFKEKRICDILEPAVDSHKLIFDESVIVENNKCSPEFNLFYQMSHITRDKGSLRHDDRLDALSLGVNYFTEMMGVQQERVEEENRERLFALSQENLIYLMRHPTATIDEIEEYAESSQRQVTYTDTI
jgi:hypothetical protein